MTSRQSPRHRPPAQSRPPTTTTAAPSLHQNPIFRTRRTQIYVAAVVVITVSSALIGASLKSRHQLQEQQQAPAPSGQEQEVQKQAVVLDVPKQIEMLQGSKARLLWERGALERKIEAVRSRAADKEQKEKEKVRLRESGMMGQAQGKDG